MKKPAKTTPTGQFDKNAIRKMNARKSIDKMEGIMDRNAGKDTKMSRDGGTNRRIKK